VFVLNPDPYSLPTYRIGPFQTKDLTENHLLPENNLIDEYFHNRFRDSYYSITYNGRAAINMALRSLSLQREDVVTILTTSGNFYISSCVTAEIEKFCRWSRELLPETKAIFVNHEFGYPYRDLARLKEKNLPIIEDCAGSFFSHDKDNTIGRTGDFVIYSFPKMFPIQIGGLLVSRHEIEAPFDGRMDTNLQQYIKNVLSEAIKQKEQIIARRATNYLKLRDSFGQLGLHERFEFEDGVVPGVFMFTTDNADIDLAELKKHFWAHGIQSSVFYGERAFFIPVHQSLTPSDLDYFFEVMRAFIENSAL